MTERLIDEFKKFHTENKRNRIENDGNAVWNVVLTELPFNNGKQPKFSLVFSRYQGTETDTTVLNDNNGIAIGCVVAVQSYWLDVDFDLALAFVELFVDNFVKENFSSYHNSFYNHEDCPCHKHDNPHPPHPGPVNPPPLSPRPSPFQQQGQVPDAQPHPPTELPTMSPVGPPVFGMPPVPNSFNSMQ